MDYKATLNLTLGDKDPRAMPQRANLPTREPAIQAYWDEIDLYKLSLERPSPLGTFVLHDGPPYSNGDIHLGHALNKIAKDIIVKFRSMQGYRAPYVPGWDNHGMPIENEVSKEFRAKGEKPDKVTMRKRCREYAAAWVEHQKKQFKRLGVRGDWDHPYLTMSTKFEATIVETFGMLAQKGFIYRGLRPVLWCASCETALADAEVEYGPHTSSSITVRFPVKHDPGQVFGRGIESPADSYLLIWTTTPWTIPANLAVAAHPDADYVVFEHETDRYLVAEPLAEKARALFGDTSPDAVGRARGSNLAGMIASHPLADRTSPVVMADYVTMEDGTGLVHTAPGHGKDDFDTGRREGLEVLCPVDASGRFTAAAGPEFVGAKILGGEADSRVIKALMEAGHLVSNTRFEHSYPHCWRCHNPLLFRATVQWFMNIDHEGHRQKSAEAIQSANWYPPVSANRIGSMVANRPDWCLSRQRAWGVGIPAFYCKACGAEDLSEAAVGAVRDLVLREGSDAWYAKAASDILPAGFACKKCSGAEFEKETDILDVWFDSGSTHRAVLQSGVWPELVSPANVYLEGSDQHRGWFNSSLMISVGLTGAAPFKSVVTNGWVLDENGKAMHKSLGNVVSPQEVIDKSGADILRLWVASTDYFEDVRCSDALLQQVSDAYRRIRNTFRFLVNNLYDFSTETDAVPTAEMHLLDQWIIDRLGEVAALSVAGYDAYEFHRVYHAVHNFCTVELSALYMDVIKDRLYCDGANSPSRRSAQTALWTLAESLARLLAPILSHTSEEVWELLGMRSKLASPQLADMPAAQSTLSAQERTEMEMLLALRHSHVNPALEAAKQAGGIGNPLETKVVLKAGATLGVLQKHLNLLPALFKVSEVVILQDAQAEGVIVEVEACTHEKCARCWLRKADVGSVPSSPDLCARCAAVVSPGEETPII